MKKRIIIVISLMALIVSSCGDRKGTVNQVVQEQDSLTQQKYVEYAETFRKVFELDRDYGLYDFDSLALWHEKCKELIGDEKQLKQMEDYFEADSDYTTYGMHLKTETLSSILCYRMISLEKTLMNQKALSQNEIFKWHQLHKELTRFCVNVAHAQYFGGSMSILATAGAHYDIFNVRVDDLERLRKELGNSNTPRSIEQEINLLRKSISDAVENCVPTSSLLEIYDKERQEEYKTLFKQIKLHQENVQNRLYDWLNTRNKDDITAKTLENISDAVKNTLCEEH